MMTCMGWASSWQTAPHSLIDRRLPRLLTDIADVRDRVHQGGYLAILKNWRRGCREYLIKAVELRLFVNGGDHCPGAGAVLFGMVLPVDYAVVGDTFNFVGCQTVSVAEFPVRQQDF